MYKLISAICASLFMTAGSAAADERLLLEQFVGAWSSNGDAFGGPAQTAMTWTPVLSGKFIRLDYRIEMPRGAETAVFEGAAYYKPEGDGRWSAFWADSSGELHPVSAARDGDAIVSHWGVEDVKYGRTRYELLPNGEMEVTDWIQRDQDWRQFNQNTFTRIEAAD